MPFYLYVIIAVVVAVVVLWVLLANYRKAGPNEVLVISGGRRRTVREPDGSQRVIGYRTVIGGGTFVVPFLESASTLPLDVLSLSLKVPEVQTAQGVLIGAEAQAQARVAGDEHAVRRAAEQFLGCGRDGILQVAHAVVEGHFRAALGALSVEEITQRREEFAARVRQAAEPDLARMGLCLLSFSLRDLSDPQGYLAALGAPRIAQVKRDAAIAQAEADKQAAMSGALSRKEGDVVKLQAETAIAEATRDFEVRRAEVQAAVNQKRAQADAAYEIERSRQSQLLKREEFLVRLLEKEKLVEIEEREIVRREKELEATVKRPADAMQYQARVEAEAEAYRKELEAKGRAAGIKLEGGARAEAARLEGQAEAEAMARRADSFGRYNQAAMAKMMVDALPALARAVAEPLAKVEKIVLVGGDGAAGASRITGQVGQVLAQLPEVVGALTGIDLRRVLSARLPEAEAGGQGSADSKP